MKDATKTQSYQDPQRIVKKNYEPLCFNAFVAKHT